MGYRELIKRYIRHLELVTGDNFVEASANERVLTDRDLGELRTLSAEILRDAHLAHEAGRVVNYNYRLRLLMNRYALEVEDVARLCDVEEKKVRSWRTSPNSDLYMPMEEEAFQAFEQTLTEWLEPSER